MKNIILISLIGLLSFTACSGSSDDDDINHYIVTLMDEVYLWYETVPDLSEREINSYSDPNDLMVDLRYNSRDAWSYVQEVVTAEKSSLKSSDDEYYIGYGFVPYFYGSELTVSYVYRSSEAWEKGIRRGDVIEEYNGYVVANLTSYDVITFYSDDEGDELTLKLRSLDDTEYEVTITNEIVREDQIMTYSILEENSKSVGYLAFNHFAASNLDSLMDIMGYFKSMNVDEMILDLRYNTGGSVNTMYELSNCIIPSQYDDAESFYYRHNDKYSDWDSTVYFDVNENNIGVDQLFVLTTKLSASASELLIKCLSPYMTVTLVGTVTHGKPVGMYIWEYDNYYIAPVSFSVYNSADEGDYYDGITADYYAYDDVSHDLGDPEEEILAEALSLIGGTVSSTYSLKESSNSPYWPDLKVRDMYVKKGKLVDFLEKQGITVPVE